MEIAMGAKKEGAMGHVLMFGLGGIFVEVLKDVSFALAPLTPAEVDKMMRSIRGYALLEGVRGRQGADIAALSQTMLKLSRLVTDIPEIQEMDLNPIIAFPPGKGAKVVDVRIKI
jgi:acyl-CoA synthetase (NDP forming)